MKLPPAASHPKLEALLHATVKHKMTPGEIWDQRVSFVYGQLMYCAPKTTREEAAATVTETYGPRPKD